MLWARFPQPAAAPAPAAYRRGVFAVAHSATVVGVDAIPVRVEAFVSGGLPSFTVVGLPGAAVQESRERVRAALKQLGLPLPPSRIVVNLAPADVRKEGPAFDLPIALVLLAADRRLPLRALENLVCFGELALDGSLQPVRGAVSIALHAVEARPAAHLMGPPGNAAEMALVPGVQAFAPDTLAAAVAHLTGRLTLPPARAPALTARSTATGPDLADVRGHSYAKRAVEVAAAGRHNLLLTGPPGAGQTMLALRLPGILPPLTAAEAVEVSRAHSSAGLLGRPTADVGLALTPPLRQPHHSGSEAGILGGGSSPRPGEISLAHNGVLFLDELPEFRRPVLEALRQPLEEGFVSISRARGTLRLPARFQLVAARNPCPCGEHGVSGEQLCSCTQVQIANYHRRLSGPLLDRIDIRLRLPRLSDAELMATGASESSAVVAQRVAAARQRMLRRQGHVNAQLTGALLQHHARPTGAAERFLASLLAHGRISGRGFDRLLRLARTVADLEGSEAVEGAHLAEAAGYRQGA